LSEDWEARLDELLGIDSQQRYETEAFKEADAIANVALYAGLLVGGEPGAEWRDVQSGDPARPRLSALQPSHQVF